MIDRDDLYAILPFSYHAPVHCVREREDAIPDVGASPAYPNVAIREKRCRSWPRQSARILIDNTTVILREKERKREREGERKT
jgi:hypothetical protein